MKTPLLLLALGLAACRPMLPTADDPRIRVAVSVPPQADFVRRIGGEHVQVEVMIPPGYSHVDYPLTPRQVAAPSRARIYGAVGPPAVGVEQIQLKAVLRDLPGVQVVDMSRGMALIAGEGDEDEHGRLDGHTGGDPHAWVAPDTGAGAAPTSAPPSA